jgi:hypothetical protein
MSERRERQFVAQLGGTNHFPYLSAHVREVCLVWLQPCRSRSAIASIAGQHRTADAIALDRFQFRNQFGI